MKEYFLILHSKDPFSLRSYCVGWPELLWVLDLLRDFICDHFIGAFRSRSFQKLILAKIYRDIRTNSTHSRTMCQKKNLNWTMHLKGQWSYSKNQIMLVLLVPKPLLTSGCWIDIFWPIRVNSLLLVAFVYAGFPSKPLASGMWDMSIRMPKVSLVVMLSKLVKTLTCRIIQIHKIFKVINMSIRAMSNVNARKTTYWIKLRF